jgi:hypothetical protein
LRPRSGPIVVAALCTLALNGCGSLHHVSNAYATVPAQLLATPVGLFEVLDRPDVGRLSIVPVEDRSRGQHLGDYVSELLEAVGHREGSHVSGSAFYHPLLQYFAETRRDCRPVRGVPLAYGQWEFVYVCSPGFDTTVVSWKPAGYSNAPLPPPPRRSPAVSP